MKLNINYKFPYSISILSTFIISIYFTYKGVIAYLIHRELYGGGIDIVISLRATVAVILILLIIIQVQFMRIKDLKSHKTILIGVFIVWTTSFLIIAFVSVKEVYFLLISFLNSIIILTSLISLKDQINEERNTLTEKEIYLLQKLANKK